MSLVVEPLPHLGITRVSRWCFNCYLVAANAGLFVVDAGMPASSTTSSRSSANKPAR